MRKKLLRTAALTLSLLLASASPAFPEAPEEESAEWSSEEESAEPADEAEAAEPASVEESSSLPAAGDKVEGFTVTEVRDFPLVGAQIVLFAHDKTGAQLMYVANEDTNRVFDLTFFTRAVDNTGLPHVFEHATLDGSEKYPSKTLFFNLSYQTYNTYMNAMTYQDMTTYPVASLSEDQLLKYADYYTDSCFSPLIMEDESIFREEAWRYRLEDAESDLTIEGTVYSEMLGAYDISRAAAYNNARLALPGAYSGNVSGGEPSAIPAMTYEALRDYHDLYYHPSNCIAFLYGKFEHYEDFLALLDEEFSKYEKREFSFEEPDYEPLTGAVSGTFAFPVEEGSDTTRGSEIYYSYLLPGLKDNIDESLLFDALTELLGSDGSPLMNKLHEALPSGEFSCYLEAEGPDDLLVFSAVQVDKEDAETFRQAVDDALADIIENGIPADLVEGIASSISLDILLSAESSTIGVDILPTIAYCFSVTGDPFYYAELVDALTALEENNEKGVYQDLLDRWITGNEASALSVTYPVPGLKEELDAALAEELASYKASLSEEELQALIDETNAEEEDEDSSAYVAALQAVDVSSLPEEVKEYDVTDETDEEGVRRLDAAAGVDGVGQVNVFLDAAPLPQDDILWFHLYLDLLGQMDTSAHTKEELAVLSGRYLYEETLRLSLIGQTGDYHPYLRFGWTGMDEDLEASYSLIREILYDTDFSDSDLLLSLIQKTKSGLKTTITNSIYNIQIYRGFAVASDLYRYYSYYNYLDYYQFLEEAEQAAEADPAAVAEKLSSIAGFFENRAGAVVAYAGNEDGIKANREAADAFLASLDYAPAEAEVYDLPVPARNEAIIIDSAVTFNAIVADFDMVGLEGYDAGMDAVTALVSDLYLLPMLRDQYGAYGAMHGALDDAGIYLLSYRDPNIAETFAVYEALPEFAENLDIDQETLDGYILSSYSYYAQSEGELSGAVNAIFDVIYPAESSTLAWMRQLKAVTPEALAGYSDIYAAMAENGVRSTAGGAAAINANADLYDVILNPFGAKDASEVEFTDVTEGSDYYEAIRAVYEEGLVAPLTDDTFGTDETATYGDLAAALYVLVGGDQNAPDDAVAFFDEYGIGPAGAAKDDELTDTVWLQTVYSLCAALGYEPDEPEESGDYVLTRGELAQSLYDFFFEEE